MEANNSKSDIFQKNFILLLTLIAFSLPFPHRANSLLIVILLSFCIIFLAIFKIQKKQLIFKFRQPALYLLFLFGVYVIFYFTTKPENLLSASFSLEKKLTFLIFPLVFPFARIGQVQFNRILMAFVLGCFFSSLICLIDAVSKNWYLNGLTQISWNIWSNHTFSGAVGIHATYLSLYLVIATYILCYFLYRKLIGKRLFALITLFFLVVIILLGVRMVILSFLLISCSGLIVLSYKSSFRKVGVWAAILLLIGVPGLFAINKANMERVKQMVNYNNEYSHNGQYQHSGLQLRLNIWHCSFELIKQKPIKGYGTGGAMEELEQCYRKYHYGALYYWKDQGIANISFNCHNQFIETFLQLGFIGFAMLLVLLITLFHLCLKEKKYLFLFFLLMYVSVMLTESTFGVQKGTVFFAYFCCLFLYSEQISYEA